MARLPPSRHPLHCDLRIPDLRARDDFPLNRSCHQGVPAICLTRRLPAQRIRRCDPNATFRTRLQQCDGDWSPLSPRCYRVAHAARLGTDIEIYDTVRLGELRTRKLGASLTSVRARSSGFWIKIGLNKCAARAQSRRASSKRCVVGSSPKERGMTMAKTYRDVAIDQMIATV